MVAEGDLNCGSPVQEVSEENINTQSRDCSCDILPKNVAVFFPHPKVCLRLKSFGLITLAKVISKTA